MAQSSKSRIVFLSVITGVVGFAVLAFFLKIVPMSGQVTVEIVKVSNQDDPLRTFIEYVVTNNTSSPIWLVDDEWFVWTQKGSEIELSFARGRMRPGAQVFGYFPPKVVELTPGTRLQREVVLKWPHPLSQIWNVQSYAERPTGKYRLSVRIGHGLTPAPAAPNVGEGVEAPVFRWQREAVSSPVEVSW